FDRYLHYYHNSTAEMKRFSEAELRTHDEPLDSPTTTPVPANGPGEGWYAPRMVGRFIDWVGGAISRTAGTGLATGAFMVLFGMTPGEWVALAWTNPPRWLMTGWTQLLVLIVGLVIIWASLRYNVWAQRQRAIDSLAEDLSGAIANLLNRSRP